MNGRHDEDINEKGILQAEKALEQVRKIDYDVIIASPLLRTKHTANIVNYKKLPILYDDRLMERDMGYLTNSERHINIDRGDFWNIHPKRDYRDVEPMEQMLKRVGSFYEDIKMRYHGKTVLVVTHDGVVRTLYGYMNGIPASGDFLAGAIKNCEVRDIQQ